MKNTARTIVFCAIILMITSNLPALPINELFVTSDSCMACHNQLPTPTGEDISIGVDWRSSMMANAARDPYWHAAVRREIMVHPMASEAIQHECSACHMPMARFHDKINGAHGPVFAHLPISAAVTPKSIMAADGVSCAVCHQIENKKLGTKESFTAGFEIDTSTPAGERTIYGPFDVDQGRQRLMRSASFFNPAKGDHMQTSEVCATCHTVITHSLDDAGNVVGELAEQVPYLEWKHSSYRDKKSCQDCHMPEVDGKVAVSSVLGEARENVSRHVFRGGNFFMPKLLGELRLDLGVAALPQELATMSERTAEHLASSAAQITIGKVTRSGSTLKGEIVINNLAGHKLPSAYPSRRVWVHLKVQDETGHIVFESGSFNKDGSIEGNDNDRDATLYEPHYETITTAEQVQIYEPMMIDPADELTTVLLSAVRYIKDNRLLPDGFDKTTAADDIAVNGKALTDNNFIAGGDKLRFAIDTGASNSPLTVIAELYYQPVAYRWAHNLGQEKAEEIERFVRTYDKFSSQSAVVLAKHRVVVR